LNRQKVGLSFDTRFNKGKSKMEIREGLTFDDLLLIPKYSEVESRSNVDLSVQLPKKFKLSLPIISANMATITGREMALTMAERGAMAIVHRFMPMEEQLDMISYFARLTLRAYLHHIGFSVGVKEYEYRNVERLIDAGARIICIDIAHGDSKLCVDMCKFIANKFPEVLLIAGNVCTKEGAKRLWRAGADLIKCNVGAGSLCTTRIETGSGVPQLTALMDVADAKKELTVNYDDYEYIGQLEKHVVRKAEITRPIGIIADGGCSKNGDLVKSLCFADVVMTGNMLAGAKETPGEVIKINSKEYKRYVGSSTHKTNHIEGVEALVEVKEDVPHILQKMREAISSGCSYQGVSNLDDLKKDPKFVRISNSGLIESNIHNVQIVKE
jgi:IMP dehydrogenase